MKIGFFGKVSASLAAFTMLATPAFAAAGPQHAPSATSAAALPHDAAANRGRSSGWGNNGWGNRWGGGWGGRRHHDDGISGGDVLAGVLVLGTIAAIASAASKNSRDKREREQDVRRPGDDDWRYGDDSRDDSRPSDMGRPADLGSSPDLGRNVALDTAIDTCVADVERGTNRVDTVDNVNRQGDGWRVEGRTQGGASWNCSVDASGRVKGVTTDDPRPRY